MVEFTEERRLQIISLLGLLNEELPEQRGTRKMATAGFVNDPRSRTCPDCLANGRTRKGCETCGGSGTVSPQRMGLIAAPDSFADDGDAKDPYQENKIQPYGLTGADHDRRVAIDAAISHAGNELRRFAGFRPSSTAEELEEANRNPYPWERERKKLRDRYDLDGLTAVLDVLRDRDQGGSAILHAVYVYGETLELSALVETKLCEALRFVSDHMPDTIRAPREHPATTRQQRRRSAAA
jgi:hypothetical protein